MTWTKTALTTVFVTVAFLCTFYLPAEAKQKGSICDAGEVVIGINDSGDVICSDESGLPPTYTHNIFCANDDTSCDFHTDGDTGGVVDRIIPSNLECPDQDDRMIAGGCNCAPETCRITSSFPFVPGDGSREEWSCQVDDADTMQVWVFCYDVDGDGDGLSQQ